MEIYAVWKFNAHKKLYFRLSHDILRENNPSDGEVNDFLNRAIDAQGLDFVKSQQDGLLFKTFKDKKLKQEVRPLSYG